MRRSMKKGFTLIELLIVVVIIGILAAVAIPKFSNTKQRASRSAGLADMRNLATAQEGFHADSNRYAALSDTGSGAGKMNFTPSTGNTNLTIVTTAAGVGRSDRHPRAAGSAPSSRAMSRSRRACRPRPHRASQPAGSPDRLT